jgi:(+)-pinoresinol hydroxylase
MRTPPGVSAADFATAIKEFENAVGKEWVFTSDADVDLYRDAYSPYWGEPEEKIASAAVAPSTVEEVQAVVRVANRRKIPLYPISTGKNLGYGGSAPVYSGSVVLDLKRMNRVLEVDEKQAYCLVEPGVSYFDLYRHLQERKIRLWPDVPDPGWGSVMGNALDRGAGYTSFQFRNHFDAHCGMEIVLANGEVVRTGMGALPGAKTWQMYKSGCGPYVDGIFSQSNFGVVTKMGFWLMPEPEAYLRGIVSAPRYADFVPLVDVMTRLENTKVFHGFPDFGSPLLGSPDLAGLHHFVTYGPPQRDAEYGALLQRGAPPQDYEPYGVKHKLPFWSLGLPFYGPEKVIRAQWEHAQAEFRKAIPGATFEEREFYKLPLSDEQRGQVEYPAFLGIPSLRTFAIGARSVLNPSNPTNGHMWFSPIIPRSGEAVLEANEVFRAASRELGLTMLTPFSLPVTCWERSFIFITAFSVFRDPAVNKKNRDAFRRLVEIAAQHGWGEYRTAAAFYDDVMDVYSYNEHSLLRLHETIKDAVDPNGILSAGRYGIWPKHLRRA